MWNYLIWRAVIEGSRTEAHDAGWDGSCGDHEWVPIVVGIVVASVVLGTIVLAITDWRRNNG